MANQFQIGSPNPWKHPSVFGPLVIALCFAALFSGCASKSDSGAGASQAEILTESDEPDTRKRARIRLELAVGYFEQGQTTVALDELKQSLSADPNFSDAHNLRGLIYMRLNDPRLAEESFKRALVINPRDFGNFTVSVFETRIFALIFNARSTWQGE